MATRFFLSRQQVSDDNGAPMSGATLDFYVTGTSTRKDTFSDAALTTANANPVVADSAGRFGDIFLGTGDYKARLSSSDGTVIWTTDPVEGDTSTAPAAVNGRNILVNGAFAVNQRGLSTAADDAYGLDAWYLLAQSGSVTIAQQTVQENGQPTNIRLTQPDVSAKRIGVAQIVEGLNCRHLRNADVALSGRIRCSLAQPIRYAILAWTGTVDAVTSDVVADWTSASYTAGGFFLGSSLTVVAVGSLTPSAAVWTALPAVTGIAPSTMNNLVVMVWTEGTIAQNATLDVGLVQLEAGEDASDFARMDYDADLRMAQRYYEAGVTTVGFSAYTSPGATQYFPLTIAPKRVAPTLNTSAGSLSNIFSLVGDVSSTREIVFTAVAAAAGNCSSVVTWSTTADL